MVAPSLNLGTHSLRASGATAADKAIGIHVSDKCLKKHGRLNTDKANEGYMVDSIERRLMITKKLKL